MAGIRIKNSVSPDEIAQAVARRQDSQRPAPVAETELVTTSKSNAGRPLGLLTQGSATEIVSKMEPGETVALARRLEKASKADPEKLYAGMSASLQSAGRRAGEALADIAGQSFDYKLERGQWKTKDGSTMLVVALTRMPQ